MGKLKLGASSKTKQVLLVMALAIFLCEIMVMLILSSIEVHDHWIEALLDSTFLMLMLTPVYFLFYRPFREAEKQHEEQIRYLSQQLISTVEDERKRITSELHDACGKSLTALQFGIQTLKHCLPGDNCRCVQLTEDLIGQTAQLSNNLRAFASRLRPEALDQLGLISALEVELKEFSRTYEQIGVELRLVKKSDLKGVLDSAEELAIYRVCQESLTNIAKHAEASKVTVLLDLVEDNLILQIKDNGVGFDVTRFWSGKQVEGIGLLGMRERVSQLGGKFTIQSRPRHGTRLMAEFPLQQRC